MLVKSKGALLLRSEKIFVWAKTSEEERQMVYLDTVATDTQHRKQSEEQKKSSIPSAITLLVPRHLRPHPTITWQKSRVL